MSKHDPYFQFPLCLLSFGRTEKERLEHIIAYSTVEAGRKLSSDSEEPEGFDETPPDFCESEAEHVTTMVGAARLGVVPSTVETMLDQHAVASAFIEEMESRHKGDGVVRIKADYAFEARDGTGLSYREFAILCALYSSIGRSQFKWVTHGVVSYRMLGYKSRAMMLRELGNRGDGELPMSPRQIGYTLDALADRKFFVRTFPGRRQWYYSIRLSPAQLAEAVFILKTRKHRGRQAQKESDLALRERIKAAKGRSVAYNRRQDSGCSLPVQKHVGERVDECVDYNRNSVTETLVTETVVIQT